MSIYNFSPSMNPNFVETFAFWESGFSDEEIQKIIDIGEARTMKEASVGGGGTYFVSDPGTRDSLISWIECNEDTVWLYDRLAYIARNLNSQFFNFDLTGFVEDFQYTVYHGNNKGHYDWHVDCINNKNANTPRKLSMVLQLSDSKDYEGGDLMLMNSNTPNIIEKKKGYLVAFPSYVLHKVSPVTKGIRKSLVVWISGPPFK